MTAFLKEIGLRLLLCLAFMVSAVTVIFVPKQTIMPWYRIFDRVDRDLHAKAKREAMN